jgi:hypothetical protein
MKPTVKVLFAVLLLAFCVVYMGNYAGIAHADPGDTGLPPAPENPFEDAPSGP